MLSQRLHIRLLRPALACALVAATLGGAPPQQAAASPAAATTRAAGLEASELRVERALQRLRRAQARSDRVERRLASVSARLDAIVAAQDFAHARLTHRAQGIYRSNDASFVSVLLSAATFEDFATRWLFLKRMNRRDAETLRRLQVERVQARRATDVLLRLQEQTARASTDITRELAEAQRDLASNRAALAAYRERVKAEREAAAARAAAEKARAARAKRTGARPVSARAPRPSTLARGAWKRAIASHYGIDFTGRGASGARIGPYSMMCAHRTLPFGTLVEFEYGGRRCVARVADRGPHVAGRTFDLGPGVARVLGFRGVGRVRYRVIER